MSRLISSNKKYFRILAFATLVMAAPPYAMAQESGSSANGAASAAGAAALIAGGSNAAAVAMLAPQCGPENPMACVMAALSAAQVIQSLGSGKSADSVASQFSTGTTANDFGGYNDLGTVSVNGQEYTADQLLSSAEAAAAALKKKGYDVDLDKGTLTTPKGTGSVGAASSGLGLADAGLLDPALADDYDKLADKMKKQKINVVAMGGGGGGGGGRSYRAPASSDDGYNFNFGLGLKPKAAKTTGLSKEFGADKIGVASDNIFDMVSRRYQALDKKGYFIKGQ